MERPATRQTRHDVGRRVESLGDVLTSVRWQVAHHRRLLLMVLLSVFAVQLLLVAIRATTGVAIAEFTRDPLGYTDLPVYKGSVSNLGVLIWKASAAICLFTFAVQTTLGVSGKRPRFFLVAGILSLVLVLDDLYMLHEVVLPDHIGIPQDLVYASYLLMMVAFVVHFRHVILRSSFLFLAISLGGFATSILADAVADRVTIPAYYLIEDGGKLLGIASWTAYFALTALREIHRHAGTVEQDRARV